MEVVAEAEQGTQAVELVGELEVDVILMDIRMPILDGVQATAQIKQIHPAAVIIILTTFDDDDYIIEGLANGAAGYLLKDIDATRLVQAIRSGYAGELMLPSPIARKLAAYISGRRIVRQQDSIFTDREMEIGSLIAQGMSNRQIAKHLFLSEGTVKNYVSELYQKLGTSNRANAMVLLKQILEK